MRMQRTSEPEVRHIALDHPDLPNVSVAVRRSRRARHVRLHVDESGAVAVSVPWRFRAGDIDGIVRERTEWLRDALTRIRLAGKTTEVDLQRGDPVRVRGQWYPTTVVRGRRSGCGLDAEAGRLQIAVRGSADPYDVLERWYREQARAVLSDRVEHFAAEFSLRPGTITVRNQRTRWGSCTHRGDLSFNWRLFLAPDWVLDAIVVHELCHIDELNHSDRFWTLLDQRFPRHRDAKAWLDQHGGSLRITAPAPAGVVPVVPEVAAVSAAAIEPDPEPVRLSRRRRRSRRAAATARTLRLFD